MRFQLSGRYNLSGLAPVMYIVGRGVAEELERGGDGATP